MWPITMLDPLDEDPEDLNNASSRSRPRPVIVEPSYFVKAEGDSSILEVELPGIKKEDLMVEVQDGFLIIKGKHYHLTKEEIRDRGSASTEPWTKRKELSSVLLFRLRLGIDTDTDSIGCQSYKDGLLVLLIPKRSQGQNRTITLN